jgi:hypothetical protein
MMIGRSDERMNPGRATATAGRSIVVVSFAEPICWGGRPDGIKCATIGLVNEP